jgi:hypothetical protein
MTGQYFSSQDYLYLRFSFEINASFNNISVLLVDATGENYRPAAPGRDFMIESFI